MRKSDIEQMSKASLKIALDQVDDEIAKAVKAGRATKRLTNRRKNIKSEIDFREKYLDSGFGGGYKKCAHSHPLIEIDGMKIQGGACASPIVEFDIEVALDSAAGRKVWPWDGRTFVPFPITDRQAPSNKEAFDALIDYLVGELKAGRSVHVGCIGGHGRTGLVLARLVQVLSGNDDAIAWLRENYCKKAVESASQVQFLVEHYGITHAAPSDHGASRKRKWGDPPSHKSRPRHDSWSSDLGDKVQPGDPSLSLFQDHLF